MSQARRFGEDQVDVPLVEDHVGFELVGVGDLAEGLARLDPLAHGLGVRHPEDPAVPFCDQGQGADLAGTRPDGRLQVAGHLLPAAELPRLSKSGLWPNQSDLAKLESCCS